MGIDLGAERIQPEFIQHDLGFIIILNQLFKPYQQIIEFSAI